MKTFHSIALAVATLVAVAAQGQGAYVFPTEVKPLLHTKWGQDAPYNKMCPAEKKDTTRKNAFAGCGPLVMSQVMRMYSYPPSSPQLGSVYAWDKMYYAVADTANVEGDNAIARLIADCGIAANTAYGTSASATKLNEVVMGMKKYFAYNRYMAIVDRSHFGGATGSRDWKSLIYDELRSGRPVIMRAERSATDAHVFVIDGCRDSMLHVNWGWDGKRNGYFNPDTLDGYRLNQRMVVDIAPQGYVPKRKSVNTALNGHLQTALGKRERATLRHLKVSGTLNRSDISILRQMATSGNLTTIDMSEAVVLTLPDSAFYGCDNLAYVALPLTLPEISASAFAKCGKLNRVDIYSMVSNIKQRAFYGCFCLTSVRLPFALREIGQNAFNSCNSLTDVQLPPMLTTLGAGAFANAKNLKSLTVPKNIKTIGTGVITGTKVTKIQRL